MHGSDNKLLKAGFLIFPAVALGVFAMITNNISPVLWGQQIGAWCIFTLLTIVLNKTSRRPNVPIWCALSLAVLALSLAGSETGGARRWLDLGIFHLNAAMLIIPVLLVSMERLNCPLFMMLSAATILSFQPDLSQFIAFTTAAITLFVVQKRKFLWLLGSTLLLVVLAVNCLRLPVTLEPVDYCEGILAMLHETSPLLAVAGIISLAVIPGWLLYKSICTKQNHLFALAVYYAVSMLFILSGNYPVPFMGFSLSPLAGYYLALYSRN